ncbi:MAG: hypothetical protein WCI04_02820 [archaeon]
MAENKPFQVRKIVIDFPKFENKKSTEPTSVAKENNKTKKGSLTPIKTEDISINEINVENTERKNSSQTKSKQKTDPATDSEELLLELLSPNKSIDLKIKEMIEEMPKAYSIILLLPRAQHELRYLRLAKYFADNKLPGIYLTLNKGISEILNLMHAQNINTDKITFIDAVTRMSDGVEVENDKFIYLESPDDMTELNRESDNAISAMKKGEGFFIIDSVTTLLVYNKAVIVEKFLHRLSQKIKNSELQGIFLAADSTDKETLDTISQFCDDVKSF